MRDIYADESSQTQHRYLVLGAVTVLTAEVPRLLETIRAARASSLPAGEMKWTKVSTAKLDAYKAVADAFFTANMDDSAHFHALIVDTSRFDHRRFNGGSREIGFSKMLFQLLAKHSRLYPQRLYAYLDSRTTRQSLDEFRFMLNRYAANRQDRRDFPFRRVVFRDSRSSDILQVNDIIIGAIAWVKNGHGERDGASAAKNALADHVLWRAGLNTLDQDTVRQNRRFTVWHFRLS